jgi:midasin
MSTLDVRVRYLTLLCLSKVYGLSDGQTQHLLLAASNRNPAQGEADEPLLVTIDNTQVDLRFLSLWEERQRANEQIAFLHNADPALQYTLSESDLCNLTSNLCGVLIPKSTAQEDNSLVSYQPRLVLTDTTKRNLHTLSLALSIGAPTLLEGATGSGKTALVEELASRTGRGDSK